MRCWEPEYHGFGGKAHFEGEVYFDGCYEETCHKGKYHGYKCFDGHCHHVCDDMHCWEPKYHGFGGKAHFEGEIYFDGCYEETCHKDHYYGYHCHEGYCKNICDGMKCWEPKYHGFGGKAHFEGEVYFDGCYEETCHKDHYYGYHCHEGYCKNVCDGMRCWEPKYHGFEGKAHFEGEVYFDGCYEETCHKDHYYGFHCHDGYCKNVCDGMRCWEPEVKHFAGKAKVRGGIYFDGCYEETCHKDHYDGYFCNHGHCGYVCHDDDCFSQDEYLSDGFYDVHDGLEFDDGYHYDYHY
ncbi:unnamed protein product [Dibothriocephalus latus]|uniref:Uncharacterized protein n=1 Tax=Dibothriocephalus latus TaxID=60516 RepID=A0A3P6QPZ7_DIBLA|nr:unnamed protein product [Dibothriocephalus latus]